MYSQLTPLEEAQVRAMSVAQGLAATALVSDLLRRSDVAREILADGIGHEGSSKLEAIKELRSINATLNCIAIHQDTLGIGA